MKLSQSSSRMRRVDALSRALVRAFPTPKLLMPRTAGIDISDSSIKWLALESAGDTFKVHTYGELRLEPGIVVSGIVQDVEALGSALAVVKEQLGGITLAHAALPEEAAYVFGMHVPDHTSREQVLRMIEFEFEGRVPIPPSAAVYDFNHILPDESNSMDEIGVVVFPLDVSEAYTDAFERSGLILLSLEVEARSIARAVSSGKDDEPITLLVDFGRARTGFAVIKHGTPIFTSTVEVGGEAITRALIDKMSLSPEEAAIFKNEQGLTPDGGTKVPGYEAIVNAASALADEVTRHYHYWDTRRNERGERMTPVGKIILVGGNANIAGLVDYIAGRVQAPTELGNVWQHVAPFDVYVPPIEKHESLQYATAIGLALRSL